MIEIQRFRASDNPKTAHTFGSDALEHVPEKCEAVFGQEHASVLILSAKLSKRVGLTAI